MYIDPFLAGILATVIVEGVVFVAYAVYRYKKGGDDEEN